MLFRYESLHWHGIDVRSSPRNGTLIILWMSFLPVCGCSTDSSFLRIVILLKVVLCSWDMKTCIVHGIDVRSGPRNGIILWMSFLWVCLLFLNSLCLQVSVYCQQGKDDYNTAGSLPVHRDLCNNCTGDCLLSEGEVLFLNSVFVFSYYSAFAIFPWTSSQVFLI